jgi:hypothetical protein
MQARKRLHHTVGLDQENFAGVRAAKLNLLGFLLLHIRQFPTTRPFRWYDPASHSLPMEIITRTHVPHLPHNYRANTSAFSCKDFQTGGRYFPQTIAQG